MQNKKNISVLFVCMGNICRSPTAEGVFRLAVEEAGLTKQIEIDSAGTHAYHIGKQPDERAQSASLKRGINLSSQRARKVEPHDFDDFDYVIAMDASNRSDLLEVSGGAANNLHLFLDFSRNFTESEVPDPYYGGEQGFEHVLDLVEDASHGLLTHIQQQHNI